MHNFFAGLFQKGFVMQGPHTGIEKSYHYISPTGIIDLNPYLTPGGWVWKNRYLRALQFLNDSFIEGVLAYN